MFDQAQLPVHVAKCQDIRHGGRTSGQRHGPDQQRAEAARGETGGLDIWLALSHGQICPDIHDVHNLV